VSKSTAETPLSERSDATIFLNGEFIPADQARVGVATHAMSYGTGCFEGIRAYYNASEDQLYIFRALEHFERLHRSCRIMNIKLPWSAEELVALTIKLIRRNGLRQNCYIRPFAYKADEIIGVRLNDLRDDYVMFTVPMGDYVATSGLRCMVSSWRRVDDNMIPARAKISGAYVNSAFAKSEALMNGFDEAIMLTSEGHVSEGSAENLFMVINGELVTPPPSENILQGITRDSVIEIARRELEMLTRERVIDRTELYVANEVLLTGTGAQIAPVVEIDHRAVGAGTIGPVASQLQQLYAEVTRGMRKEYVSWLTPVYPARVASESSNGHNGHHAHSSSKAKRSKAASVR
jgi:branched-chain amino acid aminotransferase